MITVYYRGLPYLLDLVACRRALVDCQVKGEFDSMERLSLKVAISRSTASRFFSGRPTSLSVTLKILEALHLTFEEVATPTGEQADSESQADGTAGVGVKPKPKPQSGRDGAARRSEETGAR